MSSKAHSLKMTQEWARENGIAKFSYVDDIDEERPKRNTRSNKKGPHKKPKGKR